MRTMERRQMGKGASAQRKKYGTQCHFWGLAGWYDFCNVTTV